MTTLPATCHFILYVRDQDCSTAFYTEVLGFPPSLDVPGMTEFRVSDGCVLGLMPAAGIERLLGGGCRRASAEDGTLRAEVYLVVDDAGAYHRRSVEAGAKELSPLMPRDWGHDVAYSLEADRYVLAFASPARDRTG